ncbi:OmpA family protein, partial [Comamonas terrigena]|uniref:OmpA family protein n=1 Tax=Comamonas terrigena TaxID=32013 RepID=UPI0028965FAF
APAPAPAPAPAATPPATDSFTAPEGAGVLEGMLQDMPMLRVFFDSGKTEVAPEFADKAKALVAYLQGNPDAKAVISGFNDPTGDPAKNAELSKHRAEAVQTALVAAGVPIERTALEKPADTTDTGGSNAASRRVDVVLRK